MLFSLQSYCQPLSAFSDLVQEESWRVTSHSWTPSILTSVNTRNHSVGSIAASAQAALGPVAAGSAFAVAQGIGAGAAVPSSWAAATGALAGASGVLAASGSKGKNEKEEKKGTKGGKGKKGKKGLKKRKMNDTCGKHSLEHKSQDMYPINLIGDLEASVNEGQSPL